MEPTTTTPTRSERPSEVRRRIRQIVLGLAREHGSPFLVEDLQNQTHLPGPDVAFAVRDLVRRGAMQRTKCPDLFKLAK